MTFKSFSGKYALICPKNEQHLVQELSDSLALPIYTSTHDTQGEPFLLQQHDGRLSLLAAYAPLKPFSVDFSHPDWQRVRDVNALKQSALAKAIGLKRGPCRVLDLTAGWAKDAFQLALLGCDVSCCEQHPVIAALVQDGLRRLAESQPELAARISLQPVACQSLLQQPEFASTFAVIYYDPMYPDAAYRGQVKKASQLLRALTEMIPSHDETLILEQALSSGCGRIVVKRPKGAACIAGRAPHHQINAKNVRFDVYQVELDASAI